MTAERADELVSMELWCSRHAEKWVEAMPIGNGRLGAMVFGGIEAERLQINEETLWTGQPRSYNRAGAAECLPDVRSLLAQDRRDEATKLANEGCMMGSYL